MGGGKSVFLEKLNSNIGCFEIELKIFYMERAQTLNSNIGCFEMVFRVLRETQNPVKQ